MKPLRRKRIELTKHSGIHLISVADGCIVVLPALVAAIWLFGSARLVLLPLVCAESFALVR